MDEGGLESSSEEGSSLDEPSWVSWFCMLRNHEFFCEVDPAFVQDRFNLYGLKEVVGPLYGEAMTMILGYAPTGERARALGLCSSSACPWHAHCGGSLRAAVASVTATAAARLSHRRLIHCCCTRPTVPARHALIKPSSPSLLPYREAAGRPVSAHP